MQAQVGRSGPNTTVSGRTIGEARREKEIQSLDSQRNHAQNGSGGADGIHDGGGLIVSILGTVSRILRTRKAGWVTAFHTQKTLARRGWTEHARGAEISSLS
jgi:hypothetical protein